jgi:hypothetical protein
MIFTLSFLPIDSTLLGLYYQSINREEHPGKLHRFSIGLFLFMFSIQWVTGNKEGGN